MTTHDYLVEMKFPPFASLLSSEEMLRFGENMAKPTFAACQALTAQGKILAGGTTLGAVGFAFIARVAAPSELETMLSTLPLWGRSETRVVPLGTFEQRAALLDQRLERARRTSPEIAPVSTTLTTSAVR